MHGPLQPFIHPSIQHMCIGHLLCALDIGDTVVNTTHKILCSCGMHTLYFQSRDLRVGNICVTQLLIVAVEKTKQGWV